MEFVITIYAIAFVLGSVAGSFLSVVVYRLPSIASAGIRVGATHGLLYLAWPLSFCTHCGHGIKPWHNVPIVSYLLLGGKSKCCNKRISSRYFFLELLGALLAVAVVSRFGFSIVALCVAVFCLSLLALSWIDAERFILPDLIVQPLLWLGFVVHLNFGLLPLEHSLVGAMAGYLLLATVSEGTVMLMHKRMLGAGDPKLFATLGAWLGWQALPGVLLIAAVLASSYGLGRRYIWARGSGHNFVPFGPPLAIGGVVMLFFSHWVIPLYVR